MHDPFGRRIDYLRISVTDRCNFRCRYCMPDGPVSPIPRADILSYEEIAAFVRVAVEAGIRTVRLTGGEPLVRKDVVTLVRMLAEIEGVRDLAMTTNGTLLSRYAGSLRAAGLDRVNISMDTLDPDRFRWITRGGEIEDVLAGIDAAVEAGLSPVKLNCVVEGSSDGADAKAVVRYGRRRGLQVRLIRKMDLASGEFHVVEGGRGGDCRRCNRLRLSSDGWLYPCLFSDVKVPIRSGSPEEAIRRALLVKPESGASRHRTPMNAIGG